MSEKSDKDAPVMREEYDFSAGVRGKYSDQYRQGSNVIVLDPDVAEVFNDAKAVNGALRLLAESARASDSES